MSQTVLLVDDSKTVRKAAELVCEKGDIRLLTAGDEIEAKNQAQSELPSLMVVDCQMKEQSGYDLLKELRQNTDISHIPAIMLSSHQNAYDEALGREVGVVGHLQKPFDYETFTACIQEMLAQVPEDGQVDSIPPSTLPMPAQETVRVAVEEAVQSTEPSHFEINMEESIPPTPINRQMDSVIEEVSADEIVSEEEVIAQNPAVVHEEEVEAQDVFEAEPIGAEDIIEGEHVGEIETPETALHDEELRSSDVVEQELLQEPMVAANPEISHADLLKAAMDRIPEEELMSLVKASIESVVWEVVPELAESLIKAEIERILSEKTDN